ncbi:MAG TPA: SlyX family protein [Aliiroseovarius sp.]|nr:SlyX family protein [Aliiroseovarius sp.]
MDQKRLTELEETVAHLSRMLDELSEVVARQDGEMALMAHRLQMLMERAAERELDAGGTVPLADEKPPHW